MSADQQTSHWIYRNDYPIGRTGSFDEADRIALKEREHYPDAEITIETQTLTKQVMRTYRPFPKHSNTY